MIRFHRNGTILLEGADGIVHVLDASQSLKEIADYVWENESLKGFRIDSPDFLKKAKKMVFKEPGKKAAHRLRDFGGRADDAYFNDSP